MVVYLYPEHNVFILTEANVGGGNKKRFEMLGYTRDLCLDRSAWKEAIDVHEP